MSVIGAMVFALASIVNSIVCPGFPAGYYPRDEFIPSDYRTIIITPEEYPGAHIRSQANGNLHLVEMPLGVFVKGDIIVGRNFNGHLYEIFNSEGSIIIRNMETQTTELLTLERARELGVVSYLLARDRAGAQAEAPLRRSNSTSG